MEIKLNKKEVHIVENKTATFDNGVVCEYILTNDKVTDFKFYRDKTQLHGYIPESVNVLDLKYNDFFTAFEKPNIKVENDLVAFQDKVHCLYHINDGMLKDCNLEYVLVKLPLYDLYYSFMDRNDENNIKLLAEFLRNHNDFNIVDELIIDEVPYYNQRDLDHDEDHYTQYRICTWVRFNDNATVKHHVKKSGLNKAETYFSLSSYVDELAREFNKLYPNMKEY